MHPNPAFRFADERDIRTFLLGCSFAQLFVPKADGARVAHVPLTPTPGGDFRFHISRANPVAASLDGARVVASVLGPHGYVSPDWYAEPADRVPTWNYMAVEIEGHCHALDRDALLAQLHDLADMHEARLPKRPWTEGRVTPHRLDAMYRAIAAFELRVTGLRGTAKLSQNKSPADRAGVIRELEATGNPALAAEMRARTSLLAGRGEAD